MWDDLIYHESFLGLIIIRVHVLEGKYFCKKLEF